MYSHKRKPGNPPKLVKERTQISVYFSEEIRGRIHELAEAQDKSASAFCRQIIVAALADELKGYL